jgi:hypothetical protein
MASAGGEKEKIQSPQNLEKLASSRRAHRNISNGVNGSSNGVTDRNIFCGQSFGQPSPVSRDESASVLLTSASVRMMSSIHTRYVAQSYIDMCHDDVAAPEASMCHPFLAFLVGMWTNGKVPCGSPYNHMAGRTRCGRHIICTATWQVTWQADQAGGDVAVDCVRR